MIRQGEAGAGGVAILVRDKVDPDLVIGQVAQHIGKDDLRARVQPLPIGRIMPPQFGLERPCIPSFERVAQARLGLGPAMLPVQILQPMFKRAGRLAVQLPDQHGLPVVPCLRANTANVADRQHRQQVQPLASLHRLGEIPQGARVRQVAFLRHVGHQQVIAHQPFHGFGIGLVQA